MKLAALFLLACGLPATTRIACGGLGGVDAQGNVWAAGTVTNGYPYGPGITGYSLAGQLVPYSNLAFSDPPGAVMALTVTPPTTNGTVTLKFIEPSKTAAGQRRFSVSINGTQVVKDLDLYAAVGLLHPYDLTFPFSSSPVAIVLTPTSATDKAVLSGIQVDAIAPAPPAQPPPSGGATYSAQLGDFMAVRTDAQTLTFGQMGNVSVGGIVYNFTGSVTATILNADTGTLFLYINSSGILTAGSNASIACSGVCGALPGVTAFPAGSVPLWTWTATNGTWDITGSATGVGGVDYRAFLSGSSTTLPPITAVGTPIICQGGRVSSNDLKTPGPSQEVTVLANVGVDWRFEHIMLCEVQAFTGPAGIGYTASMGRPGSDDKEVIAPLRLGMPISPNCWYVTGPPPLQFDAAYSIVVNVATIGVDPTGQITAPYTFGDISKLTGGMLEWEACGYSALAGGAAPIPLPYISK